MRTYTAAITPEMAAVYLSKMAKNRTVRKETVDLCT